MLHPRANVLATMLSATVLVVVSVAAEFTVPSPDLAALGDAPSFGAAERIVATHYFYWYRWPNEHFFNDRELTSDDQRVHFVDQRAVDYRSSTWHLRQMRDLRAAGIDVALCVYWGAPSDYLRPEIRFSVDGLPPLAQALDQLAEEGVTPPRVGMFYDTSTLLGRHAFTDGRPGNLDLRTDEGKSMFYRTIHDFFCLVPPRHWACIAGRPIVQLYGANFAAGQDETLFEYVYEHFAADFAGRRPFVIAGPSWRARGDATVGWGAALNGPILGGDIVQVGPGYDDSPVLGRTTPTRDRLGGGFYAGSWLLALQSKPRMVIIETWSEMHEGTPICETVEDGRHYIELTRQFSDRFKAGTAPAGAEWAAAFSELLRARPSNLAGRQHARQLWVSWSPTDDGPATHGLRLAEGIGDGRFVRTALGGRSCVQTQRGDSPGRYLYFDIADPYYYDHRGVLTLEVTYFDDAGESLLLEYDAAEAPRTLEARYHDHPQRIERAGSNTWKSATLTVPGARCANGENGGADFRLGAGDNFAIAELRLTKLPPDYAPRADER